MKIRITKAGDNWYHVGEEYEVRDIERYSSIGVQVWRDFESDKKLPDVVMNGDFEFIKQ